MKRVEVRLNLGVVAPLLDVIRGAVDDLKPELAIAPTVPEPDAEFAGGWKQELLQAQNSDLEVFLALFGAEFFATGVIAFDPTNAEAVLRACSAVRLRLRGHQLQALGDDALESGEVALTKLTTGQRSAFASYLFLATLQELVIQHLDPTVLDG
jgi:hypothetical protein